MKKICFLVVYLICLPSLLISEERVMISEWLITPVLDVSIPAFHNTADVSGNTFSDRQLLMHDHFTFDDEYAPVDGKKIVWKQGVEASWKRQLTDSDGILTLSDKEPGNQTQIIYVATYIHTDRWLETRIELQSPYLFQAFLNGKPIGTKTNVDTDEDDIGYVGESLKLSRGAHLLIMKMLRPADNSLPWTLKGRLKLDEPFLVSDIKPNSSPERTKDILHFMDGVKISSIHPSPDGTMYAVHYRRSLPPSDRTERWAEIRRTDDNSLVHSFRHANVSRISWLPATNALSYTSVRDGQTTIHWHHMETGKQRILLEGVSDFAGLQWSPEESYIIYSVRETHTAMQDGIHHLLGMQDRQAHFRNRSFLYKLDIASGVSSRLTFGNLSTSLHTICPLGNRVIFSQSEPDYLERPFQKHHYFMMNLKTMEVDTLIANKRWGISLQFSPDGLSLLATGGPSAFNRIGENIPQEMIANNYDTQAFILSLEDGTINPITFDFDPSVSSAHWHSYDGHIYLIAEVEDFRRLFRYNVRRERFEEIETETDFISSISFANNARMATFIGNKVNAPPKAYILNTHNERYTVLEDPDAKRYRHVVFGEVNNWNFIASSGIEITGRYYLPPDFDPEQRYPVIVYQYGGTNPVSRSFGGRYPFNLWAGNGYIVYVLQPSGATGFGQEFSAAHVNNWGKTVADEIIEGTKKFLEAHPFADPEKVGVAGASYGGFMTMLLLTHTDIFRTGISHAGISNIASYWGDGYWGYSYSAEATARSFPWDSPDIYIDQSPLFRADKVNTPLLLLTGDGDTNVPPGESIQMYTALKLLGRPVELILVEGENHHILTYSKRLKWHDAIMAWWDKHLKEQPEWWFDQFPEKNF